MSAIENDDGAAVPPTWARSGWHPMALNVRFRDRPIGRPLADMGRNRRSRVGDHLLRIRLIERALCLTDCASEARPRLTQFAPEKTLYCASGRLSLSAATLRAAYGLPGVTRGLAGLVERRARPRSQRSPPPPKQTEDATTPRASSGTPNHQRGNSPRHPSTARGAPH
jgi:hypothetical protein